MMITINRNTVVYVACPSNVATGGPELLHQLVFKLNKCGIRSFIFYYQKNGDVKIHPNYSIYITEYVVDIVDSNNNILIVPETRTFLLNNFKSIQKVIWWLSVDNYSVSLKFFKNRLKCFFRINKFFNINSLSDHGHIALHFVQSKYAAEYLHSYGITNIAYLSDYLRKEFLNECESIKTEKKNLVLYNPKKGFKFTLKLINLYPDINWTPIENLSPDEVKVLIGESKVYVDFGNHPGKDRLPRECAVLDCCIITGKRGSAYYFEDVGILEEFKFDERDCQYIDIYNKINECLNNYSTQIKKFHRYKSHIIEQESIFDKEIEMIFIK